jgi:hypothetical protein
MSKEIAVKKLIEYLRIKTVHPDPDYGMSLALNLIQKQISLNIFFY